MESRAAQSLAHALARVCLGVNICLHGLVRLPHAEGFALKLEKQFAGTFLPQSLVHASAYGIMVGEAALGFLILIGLWLPEALALGLVLMAVLQFGTALVQEWNVAGTQLIYVVVYAGLLATVGWDRWSADGLRRRSR